MVIEKVFTLKVQACNPADGKEKGKSPERQILLGDASHLVVSSTSGHSPLSDQSIALVVCFFQASRLCSSLSSTKPNRVHRLFANQSFSARSEDDIASAASDLDLAEFASRVGALGPVNALASLRGHLKSRTAEGVAVNGAQVIPDFVALERVGKHLLRLLGPKSVVFLSDLDSDAASGCILAHLLCVLLAWYM
jgi:hypothetical protein